MIENVASERRQSNGQALVSTFEIEHGSCGADGYADAAVAPRLLTVSSVRELALQGDSLATTTAAHSHLEKRQEFKHTGKWFLCDRTTYRYLQSQKSCVKEQNTFFKACVNSLLQQ